MQIFQWTFSVNVLKTSWRYVLKTSSRRLQCNNFPSSKAFSKHLQDVFKKLPRRLQDLFKTSSRRLCKTSSRHLRRQKIVALKTFWRGLPDMFWRCLQDALKTNKCFLGGFQILCDFKMSMFKLKSPDFFNKRTSGWQAWLTFWSIYERIYNLLL